MVEEENVYCAAESVGAIGSNEPTPPTRIPARHAPNTARLHLPIPTHTFNPPPDIDKHVNLHYPPRNTPAKNIKKKTEPTEKSLSHSVQQRPIDLRNRIFSLQPQPRPGISSHSLPSPPLPSRSGPLHGHSIGQETP